MPSIYDIDFSKFIPRMLPPDKRFTGTLAWLNCLLSPVQWVRDLWLGEYRTGTTATAYSAGTYNRYDRVLYNKVVYESLIDNNTDLPTVAGSWFVVQKNFIGMFERIYYNGLTITLTWAMNKWFDTTFRQPPLISDIYINNNEVPLGLFIVGITEDESSKVFLDTSSEFVCNEDYANTIVSNFAINVPVAVYNALDLSGLNNEKIFRNFVDKYVPAGITYEIITY